MPTEKTQYAHGDSREVLGVDCRFVSYLHIGYVNDLVADLGTPAPTVVVANASCSFCPACHNNDACSRQPCSGGYWVAMDKLPLLKLRGMPGGVDT